VIQRLQTVFLFMGTILNLFIFFTPIYMRAMQDPASWIGWLFSLLLAVAAGGGGYAIFLYKDRPRQLGWVRFAIVFQSAVLAAAIAILFTLGGFGSFLMREALSVVLLLLSLISFWQAYRFIKRDQDLVDSMERIR